MSTYSTFSLNSKRRYRAKVQHALVANAEYFIRSTGIQHVGFLSITFPSTIRSKPEAERRFRSLASGLLHREFGAWVKVVGRHKSGGIHYHLLVETNEDLASGFNHDAHLPGGGPENANLELCRLRRLLRRSLKAYGFGVQFSFSPVRSAEGTARYLAAQLGNVQANPSSRHVRVVSYSKHFPRCHGHRFSWSPRVWRDTSAALAQIFGCPRYEDMKEVLGRRWGYNLSRALHDDPKLQSLILGHANLTQDEMDGLKTLLLRKLGRPLPLDDVNLEDIK